MSVVHAVHNEHSSTECISDWRRSDGQVNGQVYQQVVQSRPTMMAALLTTYSTFASCKVVTSQVLSKVLKSKPSCCRIM